MNINFKMLLVVMVIFTLFAVQHVCAAEDSVVNQTVADDVLTSEIQTTTQIDDISLATESDDSQINSVEDDYNVIAANDDADLLNAVKHISGSTFEDLQNGIDEASDGDTIFLDGNTFTGSGTTITINKNLKIFGGKSESDSSMATLDGKDLSRVLHITSTGEVSLYNIHVKNGYVYSNSTPANARGAGIYRGTAGSLNIDNVIVSDCEAYYDYNGGITGGGIFFSNKNLIYNINNLIVRDNVGSNLQLLNLSAKSAYYSGCGAYIGGQGIIKNSYFINNSGLNGAGAGLQSQSGYVNNPLVIDNCYFIDNIFTSLLMKDYKSRWTSNHGGALCMLNDITCINSVFINNTASQGGATTLHTNGTIRNCTFINNTATYQFGGAISTGWASLVNIRVDIENCTFVGNRAPIGGAVQIKGDNVVINNTEFYNNSAVQGGACYIQTDHGRIHNSIFENNTATYNLSGIDYGKLKTLAGAVYIKGNYALLDNNYFYINEAKANKSLNDDGLGGALYIYGNNNNVTGGHYDDNVARNGSAIYTIGNTFKINGTTFFENQAWSYILDITVNPEVVMYDTESITVNVTHIGGNNIANAIYSANDHSQIYFYNVTYETSTYGNKTTTENEIHPVDGAENSDNGNLLYQDDREDNQKIYFKITNLDTGYTYYDSGNKRTGIYGNISVVLPTLPQGLYEVDAYHAEDTYYKEIHVLGYFRVNNVADLVVNKSVSNSTPKLGDEITWTINVANNGPTLAPDVYVLDELPEGLEYISSDATAGSYNETTHIWNIGDLVINATAELNIKTKVVKSNLTITNVATVNFTGIDPDNSSNIDNATCEVDPVVNLTISKSVSNSTPNYLDSVNWTIVVKNNGPDIAWDVNVTDNLPEGLTLVGYDATKGEYDSGVWVIGDLDNQEEVVLIITTLVNISNTSVENIAVLNTSSQKYNNSTNTTSNDTINIPPAADLNVTKIVSDLTPNYGEVVNWTITVENEGPDTSVGVYVLDKLPEGLQFIRYSATKGEYDSDSGNWTIGDLIYGEKVNLTIFTRITVSNTTIYNYAVVNSTTYDPNPSDDNASSDIYPSCDLMISKTVSNSKPELGDIIVWTITVKNMGPDVAFNSTVTDKLPDGLIYVSSSATKGEYNETTGVWLIHNIAVGESDTLNITTKVNVNGCKITNFANVSSLDHDSNESNNYCNESIIVRPISDLVITKTVSNSNPNYLDIITWTIKVKNNGPDTAPDTYVSDNLPSGLSYVSSKATKGQYNPKTGRWDIGNITNGETVTLKIKTTVSSSNVLLNNVATVYTSAYLLNISKNTANAGINVKSAADLVLKKTVNVKSVKIGDKVVWKITVKNNGPDDAVNVKVTDKLPSSLKFVSFSASKGTYDSNTGIWNIGTLKNGGQVELTLVSKALKTGKITNYAEVISGTFDANDTNSKSHASVVVKKQNNASHDTGASLNADSAETSQNLLKPTGNPILVVILSLLSLVCINLKRKL